MSTYTDEIRAWQQQRDAELRDPDGWLTLAGLFWLEPGENTCGGDAASDIVFPGCSLPRLGRFVVTEDEVVFVAEAGANVLWKGAPITTIRLAGEGVEEPTLAHGSLRWFVIRRDNRWAVRLRDRNHPALTAFRGVDYYPVDPAWRVEAVLNSHPEPVIVPVPTILGTVNPTSSPGILHFSIQGQEQQLTALGQMDGSLSLIFADATSGQETYGAGRFLTVQPPDDAGVVTIDFNRAYNPPCAFTPFATCPLPPKGNRLAPAVTAGEKKYGDH